MRLLGEGFHTLINDDLFSSPTNVGHHNEGNKEMEHELGSPKGKAQRGQYLLAVDLGRYKWYQSQTPDDVPAFSMFPEGG